MKQIPKISLSLWLHLALLVLTVLIFFATFNMPMLSTPGFESANLYVLILGPFLALAAVCNTRGRNPDFALIFRGELAWLLLHVCVNFGLLYVRSFSVTSCSVGSGIGAYFLILIPPLLLNVVIGSIIACVLTRFTFKFLAWLIFYVTYFAVKLHFWWHGSHFRFLSDISILLSSDLLEGGEITPAIMTFRLGTLCFSLALIACALGLYSKIRGRVGFTQKPLFYFVLFFTLGACAVLLHIKSLEAVGKNKNQLIQDYSLRQTAQNISIHTNPNFTSIEESKAILDEALLYQERLRKKLGSLNNKPIIIWLHHDDDQKALYTGAKNVHFAEPKQREIHISQSTIPHPVLGHELAHIYVGEHATTLWGLPGRWLVVPNIALTEGLAMMLTPELVLTNNLDLMQQAQALEQAHKGINIKTLFSMNPLDFSKSDFRASYIFSGAFLNFYLENIPEQDRPQAIQKIARAGSLGSLFNSEDELLATLDKFSSRLAEAAPAYALSWAEHNFGSKGILTSDCKDSQKGSVVLFWQALLNLKINEAIKAVDTLKSQEKITLFLQAIELLLKKNHSAEALQLALMTKNLIKESGDPRLIEVSMDEVQALILQRRLSDASELIKNIDPLALNLSARRQLLMTSEVLTELSQSVDSNYAQLLDSLLSNLQATSLDQQALLKFGFALGKYTGAENLIIKFAKYLYARMLMRAHNYQEALILLESILTPNILLPTIILDEALAMKAECLMALKNYNQASIDFSYLLTRTLSPGARLLYGDKLERIKFYDH